MGKNSLEDQDRVATEAMYYRFLLQSFPKEIRQWQEYNDHIPFRVFNNSRFLDSLLFPYEENTMLPPQVACVVMCLLTLLGWKHNFMQEENIEQPNIFLRWIANLEIYELLQVISELIAIAYPGRTPHPERIEPYLRLMRLTVGNDGGIGRARDAYGRITRPTLAALWHAMYGED